MESVALRISVKVGFERERLGISQVDDPVGRKGTETREECQTISGNALRIQSRRL